MTNAEVKKQKRKFVAKAKELGCNESESHFDFKMRGLVREKSKQEKSDRK